MLQKERLGEYIVVAILGLSLGGVLAVAFVIPYFRQQATLSSLPAGPGGRETMIARVVEVIEEGTLV